MFPQIAKKVVPAGLAGAYGYFVNNNLNKQKKVKSGEEQAPPGSRLEAVNATKDFKQGTVGYGVHPNISLIHGLFGGLGQAQIGNFFSSPETQKDLGGGIGSESNKKVASGEHKYWNGIYNNSESWNDFAGGVAGNLASPDSRAFLQSKAHDLRSWYDGPEDKH